MDPPEHVTLPDLATWRVFTVIVVLLLAALVLEIALSSHWTDPFTEFETWVIVGVAGGMAFRAFGGWLARRGRRGEETLRRLSLVLWIAAVLCGLAGLVLRVEGVAVTFLLLCVIAPLWFSQDAAFSFDESSRGGRASFWGY